MSRPPLHARLAAVLASAAALAGCGIGDRGVDRALPRSVEQPTFLSVTNDSQGPLVIGSATEVVVTEDAGRSYRSPVPRASDARAIGYTRRQALISRGPTVQVMDLGLRERRGPVVAWPFGETVVALASAPQQQRLWAVGLSGDGVRLWYSNDEARRWRRLPAVGLCKRPRALAAAAQEDGGARLYAACGPGGLLLSTNLGAVWRRLPGVAFAGDVATTMVDPALVVIANSLVAISRDGGLTWAERPVTAARVAVSPRNGSLVFAVAENGRLFASVDGGKTF
jgi:hypothetical protein